MYSFLGEELVGWLVSNRILNGVQSSWGLANSGIPQGLVLGPVLFNSFISDLNEEIECTLSTFAVNTKLGRTDDLLEGRKILQRNLTKLDQRAMSNHMTFNKTKGWVLHLGHNNLLQWYRHREGWLESCPLEKNLRVLLNRRRPKAT